MTQQPQPETRDLFSLVPPAPGKTDTSRAAAEKIKPTLSLMRRVVLCSIIGRKGSGAQVAERLGLAITSVRPRLTELQDYGFVRDTGHRTKNAQGNSEIVFEATPAGRSAWADHCAKEQAKIDAEAGR